MDTREYPIKESPIRGVNMLQWIAGMDFYYTPEIVHALIVSDAGVGKTRMAVMMVLFYLMQLALNRKSLMPVPPRYEHVYVVGNDDKHLRNLRYEFAQVLGDVGVHESYLHFVIHGGRYEPHSLIILDEVQDVTSGQSSTGVFMAKLANSLVGIVDAAFVILTATLVTNDLRNLDPVVALLDMEVDALGVPTFNDRHIGIYYVPTTAQDVRVLSGELTLADVQMPLDDPVAMRAHREMLWAKLETSIELKPLTIQVSSFVKSRYLDAQENSPGVAAGNLAARLTTLALDKTINPSGFASILRSTVAVDNAGVEYNRLSKLVVQVGDQVLGANKTTAERLIGLSWWSAKYTAVAALHRLRGGKALAYLRFRNVTFASDHMADRRVGEVARLFPTIGWTDILSHQGAIDADAWYFAIIPAEDALALETIRKVSAYPESTNLLIFISRMFISKYSFLLVTTVIAVAQVFNTAELKQLISRIVRLIGRPVAPQYIAIIASHYYEENGARTDLIEHHNLRTYVFPKVEITQPVIDLMRTKNRIGPYIPGRGETPLDPGAGSIVQGELYPYVADGYLPADQDRDAVEVDPAAFFEMAMMYSQLPGEPNLPETDPIHILVRRLKVLDARLTGAADGSMDPLIRGYRAQNGAGDSNEHLSSLFHSPQLTSNYWDALDAAAAAATAGPSILDADQAM